MAKILNPRDISADFHVCTVDGIKYNEGDTYAGPKKYEAELQRRGYLAVPPSKTKKTTVTEAVEDDDNGKV